ncbi:urease accessory protein [Dietzia kunjamensis subsp. schimae]|uniref:Urease accessory protein UreF n=1 Tax=Dietzia kunjamensis subsp. schimae TaxID=498198 RepID=A0ABY1N197_9ACTN|nr:urease accessory UreF family protein [Dietzia kunjamensis]SMO66885.1 urease accessory protein [Dietzia kunjamensis subsp. schimae]
MSDHDDHDDHDDNAAGGCPAGPVQGAGRAELSTLLLALQFTDSSFPSGMYTLSHGLEGLRQLGAVEGGAVKDGAGARSVAEAVHGILRHSAGPAEATALALAWAATHEHAGETASADPAALLAALTRIDRRLHATRLTREFRDGATRTGKQVLDLAAELLDDPVVSAWNDHVRGRRSPGSQSVVMGVVYARGGLSQREAVAADLTALVISLSGAALRLRLADHRTAQALVRGAAPVIAEVADAAVGRSLEELGGFAPVLDLASCHHERADARLFAS